MTVNCVWEHNGADTLLYAVDYIGAYTRGESLEIAQAKMPQEIVSYLRWLGEEAADSIEIIIVGEKSSDLAIQDADSDVLFESEKAPLTAEEYRKLKALALKSAKDFLALYESIPNKDAAASPARKTFYGNVPRSAAEMYEHTKNVNEYYFAEIEVDADNTGNIYECRRRGFEALESKPDFLKNAVIEGSYGEDWSLRKVLRRFIWHDRIHARAMYRMATKVFGSENIADPFYFDLAIEIRSLTEQDYPAMLQLYELLDHLHYTARPDYFVRRDQIYPREHFLHNLAYPGGLQLGAFAGDRMIGFAAATLWEESGMRKDLKTVCLDNIYVLPEYRRNAVAARLFAAVEDWARARGAVRLDLHTWSFNQDAIALYEAMGMTPQRYIFEKKL